MKLFPYQIKSLQEYKDAYVKSIANPADFWNEIIPYFRWTKVPTRICEYEFNTPNIKWFEDGILNITENCIDRWVERQPDRIAIIFEPNNPEDSSISITYKELLKNVCQWANLLQSLGVQKGDRICIYMPMCPALAYAVLACARIGAIHSVVFGGFSAWSIAERIQDAGCTYVITADGCYRGEKYIPLKITIDEALKLTNTINKVLVYQHSHTEVPMQVERDIWIQDYINLQDTYCTATPMHAEDILFILYTSGSTGKPKGVVHTIAGYLIWVHYTFINVFQIKENDIHFCTADLGWITGHSYVLYGPLSAGVTTVMYEGLPHYPDAGSYWKIIQKHGVNIFYTAPTALRSLMTFDVEYIEKYDLQTLRVLGTVGEPINEEAWHWYDKYIGRYKCPIVDTWWQTETGGIMISNLAGITDAIPTFATLPLPGIVPKLLNEYGEKVIEKSDGILRGNLCIAQAWPSILRTTYNDHERCRINYFSTYPKYYFTGDGAIRDDQGNYRIIGRIDDVLNVSGHRIGTAELENAINSHKDVIESAVVDFPHHIKGQGIYVFIISNGNDIDKNEITKIITQRIGSHAKPDKIQFVEGLPKTRSGKIMRRILRKIASHDWDTLGDVTTLFDSSVVEKIIKGYIA